VEEWIEVLFWVESWDPRNIVLRWGVDLLQRGGVGEKFHPLYSAGTADWIVSLLALESGDIWRSKAHFVVLCFIGKGLDED